MANEQLPLSKGLLFLAFDNEQKGQKNYLDRGHNTVIFHTVTSFVAFNYDQNNNIQITDPWLYSTHPKTIWKIILFNFRYEKWNL